MCVDESLKRKMGSCVYSLEMRMLLVSCCILPFSPGFQVLSKEVITMSLSNQKERDQRNICKGPQVRQAEPGHVQGQTTVQNAGMSVEKRAATRGETEKPQA